MNLSAQSPGFDQRVRERAYALWEREGRPSGRHAEHWRLSEEAALAELRHLGAAKPALTAAPQKKASVSRRLKAAAPVSLTH